MKTVWQPDRKRSSDPFSADTVTYVDVIQPLSGTISPRIKIRHHNSIAACGVNYSVGGIQLFILHPMQDGEYSADDMLVNSAPTPAIIAYYTKQIDITVAGGPLEYLSCEQQSRRQTIRDCLPQEKIDEIYEIASQEYQAVSRIKLPWWRRFRKMRPE
ncbi:MAG: hypothetical protein ACSHXY_14150 [Alphaproteobacteria bacterium]